MLGHFYLTLKNLHLQIPDKRRNLLNILRKKNTQNRFVTNGLRFGYPLIAFKIIMDQNDRSVLLFSIF